MRLSLRELRIKQYGFGADIQSKKDMHSGAFFHQVTPMDLMKYGLIPEFIGRIPVTVALDKLTVDDLVAVLTQPKNAIVKQYKKILRLDDVELEFTDEAIRAIAEKSIEQKTGARGLRSIIEEIMRNVMYDIPSTKDVSKCIIDEACIREGKEPTLIFKKKKASGDDGRNGSADSRLDVG